MASFMHRMTSEEAADTRKVVTALVDLVAKLGDLATSLTPLTGPHSARYIAYISELFSIIAQIYKVENMNDTAQRRDQLSGLAERIESITKEMIELIEGISNGARPQAVDGNSARRYFENKNKSKNMPLLVKVLKKKTKILN